MITMTQMLESVDWVVLGFTPTLAEMESAWGINKRGLASVEEVRAQ
jgi:hypothetical protein